MSTPVTFSSPLDPHKDAPRVPSGIELSLNGIPFRLSLRAAQHTGWISLPMTRTAQGARVDHRGIKVDLILIHVIPEEMNYTLRMTSAFPTRLRVWIERL